jgi:hypothetical protein
MNINQVICYHFKDIPIPVNPFKSDDDLGYPPKIVM